MQKIKKFFVGHIREFQKRTKKIFRPETLDLADSAYALTTLVFSVGVLLLGWFGVRLAIAHLDGQRAVIEAEEGSGDVVVPCLARRILDGVCVAPGKERSRIIAVMVENSRDAWPLSGISRASVVYEAPAEANIPRFMALYPEDAAVSEVGPVRSARPYYLDWVAEYGAAMYLHVGGSPDALELIDARDMFDMSEMSRGQFFWRSRDRLAPHNTYTSDELWREAEEEYGGFYSVEPFAGWTFDPAIACTADCIETISVAFSPVKAYEVTWRFVSSTGAYERLQGGSVQHDADGIPVVADTIIIQRVEARVLDAIGRLEIGTMGQGEAMILANGKLVEGKWKKEDAAGRTEWLDAAGVPIPLKPGRIWIEVVPQYGTVTLGGVTLPL